MKENKLVYRFRDSVTFVNEYSTPIPADVILKLYAYYKIANENFEDPKSRTPLINAFKSNALIQAKDITGEQAMELYISLVDKELR